MKALIEKIKNIPAVAFLMRLFRNIGEDYIGLLAAGCAFYFFMASFPAIGAAISLYGLFADPIFVTEQIDQLARFMPPESLRILQDQAASIASSNEAALGLGVIVGLVLTIYSTTKGVKALISGLNIAYGIQEHRNVVALNVTSFTLTFVMLAYMLFALSAIALMPALFNFFHLPSYIADPLLALRWPLLLLSAMVGIQMIYTYAPNHKPDWRWASWGAAVATVLWVGGSSLFSLFVSNFGNYNETYGSLGAVAVLLLWFWLTAMIILVGAEVNVSVSKVPKSRHPGQSPADPPLASKTV